MAADHGRGAGGNRLGNKAMTVLLQARYRHKQGVGAHVPAVIGDAAHGNCRHWCVAGKAESVRQLRQQGCQRSFTVNHGCGKSGGLGL